MLSASLLSLLLASCASDPWVLQARAREGGPGPGEREVARTLRWDPERTAVVVVDMWDDHWCAGAAARVGELAEPVNAFLHAARSRGALILHAPSSVTHAYAHTPQRALARAAPYAAAPRPLSTDERWGTNWCWPDEEREGALPIDDSDMGCDCEPECELREPWTRQIDTIELVEGDALTDDGQETWNLFAQRDIQHVLILGVHLNMCVLGRPFGIRQLVGLGLDVALVRDLTDSMYDSRMRPHVSHHAGTALVVEHVERHWCPSVLSSELLGGAAFRFADAPATDS